MARLRALVCSLASIAITLAATEEYEIDDAEVRVLEDGSTYESLASSVDASRELVDEEVKQIQYAPFEQDFAAFREYPIPVLPSGRSLEFPADASPRTIALCPSRGGLIAIDATPHGNLNANKMLSFLYGKRPYPWAYLVHPSGDLVRKMEFGDRQVLPYGVAEATDGRVAITFYTAIAEEARLEVWERDLARKLTFHEYSLKPALPTFDKDGLLWVPYTILDRLNEEHPTVIALWAYKPDGGRWEVFPRRQLQHVRFPHSVHIDNCGRLYIAGLAGPKWPYIDDTYGLGPRPDLDLSKATSRIDVYSLVKDPAEPAYQAEQIARWQELNGGWDKAGQPPNVAAYESIRPAAVLKLHRSFAMPFLCVQTLFALTGDGYALAACNGESKLAVLRLGAPGRAWEKAMKGEEGRRPGTGSGNDVLRGAWAPLPTYSSIGRTNSDGLSSSDEDEEVIVDLDEGDGTDAGPMARVVVMLERPFGAATIGSIQMDPSGTSFALLDTTRRRIVSSPWPLLKGDSEADKYTLPRGESKKVKITW